MSSTFSKNDNSNCDSRANPSEAVFFSLLNVKVIFTHMVSSHFSSAINPCLSKVKLYLRLLFTALYPRQSSPFAFDVPFTFYLLSAIRHRSFTTLQQTCNISVSQCDVEVWEYDVRFPCDIQIIHFQFQATIRQAKLLGCHFIFVSLFNSRQVWMGTWIINCCNTL